MSDSVFCSDPGKKKNIVAIQKKNIQLKIIIFTGLYPGPACSTQEFFVVCGNFRWCKQTQEGQRRRVVSLHLMLYSQPKIWVQGSNIPYCCS